MPAGLRVIGDHTIAQIDETYRNLVFKSKSTLTMDTTLITGTSIYGGNFNVTADTYPFLAVRSSAKVSFAGFTKSGSTYTMYYFTDTSGASVEWYHFDTPTTGETTNYLAIYDSAAQLVYNALDKAMIITDFKACSNTTYTGTSGRKYAGMQTAQGYAERERAPAGMGTGSFRSWQPYQTWSSDIAGTFSGNLFSNGLVIEDVNVGAVDRDEGNQANTKFLIVDVTGL